MMKEEVVRYTKNRNVRTRRGWAQQNSAKLKVESGDSVVHSVPISTL